MTSLPVRITCPLGHSCEKPTDKGIERCAWFIRLAGTNPTTGEQADEHGCAMSWLPVLLVENARVSRGTSAAVESFRNEMVEANQSSARLLTSTKL